MPRKRSENVEEGRRVFTREFRGESGADRHLPFYFLLCCRASSQRPPRRRPSPYSIILVSGSAIRGFHLFFSGESGAG